MRVVDGVTFVVGVQEIFEQRVYEFQTETKEPLILDCGANIGLSVIYFKRLYPRCRVVAFEADPNIFSALETNVHSFALNTVTLRNEAVWNRDGRVKFHLEGGASGRVVDHGGRGATQSSPLVEVRAKRLRNLLGEVGRVDFLKIDIEGAETEVLLDCAEELGAVENLFVEYHSVVGQPQTLVEVLDVIRRAGFRYFLREAYCPQLPYLEQPTGAVMDNQVNIFAVKV